MDKELEDSMRKVGEILERIEPMIQRYIAKTIAKDGTSVALSVACNMSTSLMCAAMMLVEACEGDVDEFMNMMVKELILKHSRARVLAQAQIAILNAKFGDNSGYTCQPLH